MDAALNQLRSEGWEIADEDNARLSPLPYSHFNLLGRYQFSLPDDLKDGGTETGELLLNANMALSEEKKSHRVERDESVRMVSPVVRFKPAIILGSFLCGLLVGTAVFFSSSARGGGDRCNPNARPVSSAPNIFDPAQLQAGDRFLGLTVKALEVFCRDNSYSGRASFQGEIVVSGVYDPQTEVAGGTASCFHVVRYSELQLPRLQGDERNPWFCFQDVRATQELFGDREQVFLAQIAIENYQIIYKPTDATNGATLVRVINKIPLESQ